MKTFKEYTEYMGGVRLGNYSRYHPMASLGDSPPKNFDRNYQSRGVGLHAGYGGNAGTNTHGRGHMNLKPQASLNAETNPILKKIKDKYELTKDQLAALTRLPMPVLTNILNSAGQLAQYLPMSEELTEMSGTALGKASDEFKSRSSDMTQGRQFSYLAGLMKNRNHSQLAKDLKGFISRNMEMKKTIIKILSNHLTDFQVKSLTENDLNETWFNDIIQNIRSKTIRRGNYTLALAALKQVLDRKHQQKRRHDDEYYAYQVARSFTGVEPRQLSKMYHKESLEEAEKRVPRKYKSQDPDKHSDLYTDEDPKDTIKGLGFVDGAKARESINIISKSGRPHAHKMQAAMAMHQRARVAADRAKNPDSKKNLHAAEKVYKAYIEKMKKITIKRREGK